MNLSTLSALLSVFAGIVLATWVLVQSREQRVRWAFALGMLALSAESLFSYLCLRAGSSIDFVVWETWRMLAVAVSIAPWVYFSLVYARGDARVNLKAWRPFLIVSLVAPTATAILFRDDIVISIRPSDYGFLPTLGVGQPALVIHFFALAACVIILMNLERTFRASIGTLRWRIKFMVLGLGAIFAARLFTSSHALLFQVFNLRFDNLNSVALLMASILIMRALLRSGQFEVELYPSQSVLRNSVTIIFVGAYLTLAGLAAKFVSGMGRGINLPRAGVVLLVAGIFLTIALMSDRLRLLVAKFVSRHFQRPLYDYRSVWRQYTEATSSPRGLEDLGWKITRLTSDTFEVQSASLWIYDQNDRRFIQAASTAQAGEKARAVEPTAEESAELYQYFSTQAEPSEIETREESWARVLKRCHPAEFEKGGNRVVAPLLHHGEPLGMLLLGDRIGNVELGTQDFDMLKCVADHVCASLLNVQLSRQLLQARELAAFQTMAAFFVHDIKNAASTLNLMLPNLRTHWDTPGFREDALRGISRTVEHMNSLVQRLSQLRSELTLQPKPARLDQLTGDVLDSLPTKPGISLVRRFEPVPQALLDAEQLRKVITNLVLNAYDAVPGEGRVEVAIRAERNWLLLSVTDTGKGMPPEFLQKSLFRPFQTTKKGGLGIGMFHTRMIIEAHGGRIGVVSEVGAGTTFNVSLPVREDPKTP